MENFPQFVLLEQNQSRKFVDTIGRNGLVRWKESAGRGKEWRRYKSRQPEQTTTISKAMNRAAAKIAEMQLTHEMFQCKKHGQMKVARSPRATARVKELCDRRGGVTAFRDDYFKSLEECIESSEDFCDGVNKDESEDKKSPPDIPTEPENRSFTKSHFIYNQLVSTFSGTVVRQRYLLLDILGHVEYSASLWNFPELRRLCAVYLVRDLDRPVVKLLAHVQIMKGSTRKAKMEEAKVEEALHNHWLHGLNLVCSQQRKNCLIIICHASSYRERYSQIYEEDIMSPFSGYWFDGNYVFSHAHLKLLRDYFQEFPKPSRGLGRSNKTGLKPDSESALSRTEYQWAKEEIGLLSSILSEKTMKKLQNEVTNWDLRLKAQDKEWRERAKAKQRRKRREAGEQRRI